MRFGVFLPISARDGARDATRGSAERGGAGLRRRVVRRSRGHAVDDTDVVPVRREPRVHRAARPPIPRFADVPGVPGGLHGADHPGHQRAGAALSASALLGTRRRID